MAITLDMSFFLALFIGRHLYLDLLIEFFIYYLNCYFKISLHHCEFLTGAAPVVERCDIIEMCYKSSNISLDQDIWNHSTQVICVY